MAVPFLNVGSTQSLPACVVYFVFGFEITFWQTSIVRTNTHAQKVLHLDVVVYIGLLRIEGMLHIYVFAVVFTTYISVRFIRLCRGISRYIHIFSRIETRIRSIATFYVLYPDLPRYLKSYIVLFLLYFSPRFN
jgi:hypothetical protein